MRKKCGLIMMVVIIVVIMCCGCGTLYECSTCGASVRDAYYDPFRKDTYFCEDCAWEYFAPMPYSAYRVE